MVGWKYVGNWRRDGPATMILRFRLNCFPLSNPALTSLHLDLLLVYLRTGRVRLSPPRPQKNPILLSSSKGSAWLWIERNLRRCRVLSQLRPF